MNFEHLRTIRQLAEANPAFSEASLRWMVFQATNNGLSDSGAIVRLGRRVLIDQDRFGRWLENYRESK